MLETVRGRAGSGKSRYIVDKIRGMVADDPLRRIIVICPEQYTFQMERDIIGDGGTALLCAEVLSVSRLVHRITGLAEFDPPTVTAAAMAMQVSQILRSGSYASFERTRDRAGIETALMNTLTELKRYDVSPEEILQKADAVSIPSLAQRMRDIAEIAAKLRERNAGRYDSGDLMNAAIGFIDTLPFFDDFDLVVDGLDMLTPQVKRMLFTLIVRAKSSTVAFRCGDETDADAEVLAAWRGLMEETTAFAKSRGIELRERVFPCDGYAPRHTAPELRHLEKNLYARPYEKYSGDARNISLLRFATASEEIRECVRRVFELTRGDLRYRDIAVAAPASYLPILRRELAAAEIPNFADTAHSVTSCRLFAYLSSACELICGRWSVRSVRRFLKCGLAPITDAEANMLLSFMREYGIAAYALRREIRGGTERYPGIEDIRARAFCDVLRLRAAELTTADACADALRSLMDADLVRQRLADELAAWEENGLADYARAAKQSCDRIADITDTAREVLLGGRISMRLFSQLFAGACGLATVMVIPPTNDEVTIVSLSHTKMRTVKALFVLGASDVNYGRPAAVTAVPQSSAAALCKAGISFIKQDRTSELEADIYELLTKPSELLVISSAGNVCWAAASRIERIFGITAQTPVRREIGAAPKNIAAAEVVAAACGAKYTDAAAAWARLKSDGRWREAVERAVDSRIDDSLPIAPDVVKKLYPALGGSVTRLEEYARCPFRFFAKYGMGLLPDREFSKLSIDWGNVLHDTMDAMAKKLLASHMSWGELAQSDAETMAGEIAAAIFDSYGAGRFAFSAREKFYKETVCAQAGYCAGIIARQFAAGDAELMGSEIVFGGRGAPALTIPLPDGGTAAFTGKVDRADVMDADGTKYLRIVDYKSSALSVDMSELFYGLDIQLMTYLGLLCESGGFEPAGAYYFDMSHGYSRESEEERCEAKRMQGYTTCDAPTACRMNGVDGGKLVAVKQRVNRDGSAFYSSPFTMSGEQAKTVFKYLKDMIARTVCEIATGNACVKPFDSERGASGCDWCDYAGVCLFDGVRRRQPERGLRDIEAVTSGGNGDER